MLKTFLPKAFRSEKTPSNKGYFNLENWIQARIQDGTIDLGAAGTDIYSADGNITENRVVDIAENTSLSFSIDGNSGNAVQIEAEGQDVKFLVTSNEEIIARISPSDIMLGNTGGGPDDMSLRSFVALQTENVSIGVYDGNTESVESFISFNNGDDGNIRITSTYNDVILSAQAFDITSPVTFNDVITLASVTTVQRDSLTPVNGMIIYNSTDDEFQGYQATTWVTFDTTPIV